MAVVHRPHGGLGQRAGSHFPQEPGIAEPRGAGPGNGGLRARDRAERHRRAVHVVLEEADVRLRQHRPQRAGALKERGQVRPLLLPQFSEHRVGFRVLRRGGDSARYIVNRCHGAAPAMRHHPRKTDPGSRRSIRHQPKIAVTRNPGRREAPRPGRLQRGVSHCDRRGQQHVRLLPPGTRDRVAASQGSNKVHSHSRYQPI